MRREDRDHGGVKQARGNVGKTEKMEKVTKIYNKKDEKRLRKHVSINTRKGYVKI